MGYKMKGFSGFGNSPLKQDYTTQTVTDEDLEKSRNRMNARADAIEKIKNMPIAKGLKGEARSEKDKYTTKGEKEAITAINEQLREKRVKATTDEWSKMEEGWEEVKKKVNKKA
jgi:small-conductance mechanosensitive channel